MRFSGEWKFALAAGHVNFREDLPQTAQIAVLPAGRQVLWAVSHYGWRPLMCISNARPAHFSAKISEKTTDR